MRFKRLSSDEITLWVQKHRLPNFGGVVAMDQLSEIPPNKWCIVNLERAEINGVTQPGTHWELVFPTKSAVYFFDSFGIPPNKEILNWWKQNSPEKDFYYQTSEFQPLEGTGDESCGYFCLFVAYILCKGLSFKSICQDVFQSSETNFHYKHNLMVLNKFFKDFTAP